MKQDVMKFVRSRTGIWAAISLLAGVVLVTTGYGGFIFGLILAWLVGWGFTYLRGLDRRSFGDVQQSFQGVPSIQMVDYEAIHHPKPDDPHRLWYERARESVKQALLPTQMATFGLIVAFILSAVKAWQFGSLDEFLHNVQVTLPMWVVFWSFEAGLLAYQEGTLRQRYRILILEWTEHVKQERADSIPLAIEDPY